MKENVFDVLMYLFENYFHDPEADPDRESLASELSEAGFGQGEVRRAFEWLDTLANSRDLPELGAGTQPSLRIFTPEECGRLEVDCRGFILYLEQAGILSPTSRELVIDRTMALDDEEIDLDSLKWVVLMVLFSQPGQEEAYAWMENLVFDSPIPFHH